MSPALTEDHLALAEVARSVLAGHGGIGMARAVLEVDDPPLPPSWPELSELGWLGLHVPEQYGGQGYGLAELTVIMAELGRVVMPGPFLPTVNRVGHDRRDRHARATSGAVARLGRRLANCGRRARVDSSRSRRPARA